MKKVFGPFILLVKHFCPFAIFGPHFIYWCMTTKLSVAERNQTFESLKVNTQNINDKG